MPQDIEGLMTRAAMADVRKQLGGRSIPGVPQPPAGPDSWTAEGGSVDVASCVRAALAALEQAGYAVVKAPP